MGPHFAGIGGALGLSALFFAGERQGIPAQEARTSLPALPVAAILEQVPLSSKEIEQAIADLAGDFVDRERAYAKLAPFTTERKAFLKDPLEKAMQSDNDQIRFCVRFLLEPYRQAIRDRYAAPLKELVIFEGIERKEDSIIFHPHFQEVGSEEKPLASRILKVEAFSEKNKSLPCGAQFWEFMGFKATFEPRYHVNLCSDPKVNLQKEKVILKVSWEAWVLTDPFETTKFIVDGRQTIHLPDRAIALESNRRSPNSSILVRWNLDEKSYQRQMTVKFYESGGKEVFPLKEEILRPPDAPFNGEYRFDLINGTPSTVKISYRPAELLTFTREVEVPPQGIEKANDNREVIRPK